MPFIPVHVCLIHVHNINTSLAVHVAGCFVQQSVCVCLLTVLTEMARKVSCYSSSAIGTELCGRRQGVKEVSDDTPLVLNKTR